MSILRVTRDGWLDMAATAGAVPIEVEVILPTRPSTGAASRPEPRRRRIVEADVVGSSQARVRAWSRERLVIDTATTS